MPYIGKTTDGFGVRNRFVYLASSGDTSVSGADANGATLTFTDGAYVDVYLNGVLLKPGTDYNTNTANTIAGISSMAANDEVTVVVYDVFTVADMVSATSGGTFSGAVTANSTLDMNGTELILDADGDTSITADTDDQIDIKIAGADDFAFKANTLEVQTGSNIDMNGTELILDADGDTSITADTDDRIDFKVAGSDKVHIDSTGRLLLGTSSTTSAMFTITPTFQIEGTDFNTSSMSIFKNSNDGEGAFLFIGKSKGTSVGSDTSLTVGNDIGTIAFVGADGTDRQNIAASIVGKIASDVSPGSNDMPGTINFNTTSDGATSATVRMSLDQQGRLRMGSDGEPVHRLVSQHTEDVGTSAQVIATVGLFSTFGGHYFVTGRNQDSTASRFCDQLTIGLNGSINVLHSTTVRGSPHSRTYALSSENLTLAMGSANYTINVFAIDHITS